MRDVYETRRANLRRLIDQWGGPTTLAKRLGHSNGSYLAQLAGPHPSRELTEKVARGIEGTLALPSGWLDHADHGLTSPLDDALLARCITVVTSEAHAEKVSLNPDKLAEVVGMVYGQAQASSGLVDECFVKRLLRLLR